MSAVGIIANPSSGKDIRRLVARGSVFDNNEKANIVRRALLGLDSVGVRRVLYMPDHFAIVPRALDGARLGLEAESLPMPIGGDQRDSTLAAELLVAMGAVCIITLRLLVAMGAVCIITLGGDGTNRAVARGCGAVPLVPVSTGTNNVFPVVVEGTLAGLAAGLLATRAVDSASTVQPCKRLEILVDGEPTDIALIDAALSRERFVGSRAIWDPRGVLELVLSTAEPGSLGLSAIGAHLSPVGRRDPGGLHLRLGESAARGLAAEEPRRVLAPIAPGLVVPVAVQSCRPIPAAPP